VSGTPAPSKVAAIQFEPVLFEKDSNIARLVALTEEAAQNGARLIVHPEMATTGYCWQSREEIAPFVEPIPGPTTERFSNVAARNNCFIVVGLPEINPATGIFYNSAALIGPTGLIGVYRKTHSYISEPKWAKDGDLGIPVFDTEIGRIGTIVCMDASFPEPARVAALNGADVICFPTNWLGEKSPSPVWIARAYENTASFIAANRYGCERGVQFSGGSCVISAWGEVQDFVDTGDGIAYGYVDPHRTRDLRVFGQGPSKFSIRRPDAYGNLTLNTYLWNAKDFHNLYDLRPLPEGRRSTVAVAQFSPAPAKVEANLDRIADLVAANADVDLFVFPELALSGSIRSADAAQASAESIPSPATDRLQKIAAAHRIYLVMGLAERDGDQLFNSAVLVGPDGLIGTYRKLHLSPDDCEWATPGNLGLPTFDIPVGRVGMLIGSDVNFPEAARCLALDGADVIAWPSACHLPAVSAWGATAVPLGSNIETGPTDDHFHIWRERSTENCTYVAFANSVKPGMGWSGIFAPTPEGEPKQNALLPGDCEGIARLEIDTTNLDSPYVTNYARAKDLLGMRIPIWYDVLQASEQREDRCPE
jgi:predicted amidohydrolase